MQAGLAKDAVLIQDQLIVLTLGRASGSFEQAALDGRWSNQIASVNLVTHREKLGY